MKKVLLSTVLFGLAFSASSVFAEEGVMGIQAISAPIPTPYTMSAGLSLRDSRPEESKDVVVPQTPEVTSVSPVTEKTEMIKFTSLSKLKARGAQLIKERINSLNANAQAIANSKALTTDQKTAFAMFFTEKIASLNTLNGKIASSTDATSTKALVSSIFTDYRVYGVLIPQLRLEKRLYELQAHSAKLSDVFTKVQTRINEFKAKGKDVSVWQKNLDDTKALVATDTAKIPVLLAQINALHASDYGTTSKSVIESVNKDTKAIARDFQSVNRKVMRPSYLKTIKDFKMSTSTSATTTAR